MGCTASRLEDEEAVQLCKDRRNFIKQAVEQRIRFASSHIAYIQSLKRVSSAIQDFVDSDWQYELFSDPYATPPFMPVKRLSPEFISIPIKPPISASSQPGKSTLHISKYLSSGSGNQSVTIEELPRSPEILRVESYYSRDHYGIDGFFAAQASPIESSFTSPYNRPSFQAASPQNSQWDSFWNPFSSLDVYGYHYQNGHNEVINDDDLASLRQVREEEGIPELEEEEEEDNDDVGIKEGEEFLEISFSNERRKSELNHTRAKTEVEDSTDAKVKVNVQQEMKELKSKGVGSVQVSEPQNTVELEVNNKEELQKIKKAEETPGFTVYLNPRPTSMAEIIKVIENEFARICDYAHEVSVMLEASRAQYSSTSTEITAAKILNPVALFRSASSRSTSSRFFLASSSSRDDGYDSSSEYSDDSCMISGSHQSTLDRLYAWEKKLYLEVKAGERTRIAFEKKCMLLKNQDANGEDPSSVEKTRRSLRDLHTRLKISIHSVQSVSKRIETLRDEELQPQLMELLQGLDRMWKATADCHQVQKCAVDEAKLLLVSSSSKKPAEQQALAPPRQLRSAAVLEAELRNWRSCLGAWLAAQRSYARALAGWILRCGDPDPGAAARSPLSPRRSSGGGAAAAVLGVCVQWSRMLDSVGEAQVLDGLDFFAAGMASVSGRGGEAGVARSGSKAKEVEEPAVTAEFAGRVLWAGMSVAVSSLADFAARSAEGYDLLVKRAPPGEDTGGTTRE